MKPPSLSLSASVTTEHRVIACLPPRERAPSPRLQLRTDQSLNCHRLPGSVPHQGRAWARADKSANKQKREEKGGQKHLIQVCYHRCSGPEGRNPCWWAITVIPPHRSKCRIWVWPDQKTAIVLTETTALLFKLLSLLLWTALKEIQKQKHSIAYLEY